MGLVLLVLGAYNVEEAFGLPRLLPLLFAGFLLHALLPLRLRLPFFLALSLAGFALVLGLKQAAGLTTLGLGLVALCHLPVAFGIRVGLVVASGAALAAVRAGLVETGWQSLPTLVLPVLGALFMFRLAVYLYDLRHEQASGTPASLWVRLSYFFLLPNVCFLLFPVVDYQTFRRTYYDAAPAAIYQKGVRWMLRGAFHLLLYRVVYHHLVLSPAEVASLGGVVQALGATYGLYLRISGLFHLAVGMLCLFGFNLPETHHHYFLASSFTDYWRRINIYWKDFMQKLVYFPVLMRLRRWGLTAALIGATVTVFAATWLLHSYQWFWLQGTFPLAAPDALFWGILGGLVVINALREVRRPQRKRLRRGGAVQAWDGRAALALSMRTVGMLVVITVLWSLWSSPSVGAFVGLMAQAGNSGAGAWGLLGLGLVALVGVGVGVQYGQYHWQQGWQPWRQSWWPQRGWWSGAVTSLGAVALLAVGQPTVQGGLPEAAGRLVASVQAERLNRQDALVAERGYYEGLLSADGYTAALWQARASGTPKWGDKLWEQGVITQADDWLQYELGPSRDVTIQAARFRTNRWGMRDREYALEKPAGTYRIALLGSSHAMGWGVSDEEVFEAIVEAQLNQRPPDERYQHYEILNFAVQGYSLLHHVSVLEAKVLPFNPDAVVVITHQNEGDWVVDRAAKRIKSGVSFPYPDLAAIVSQAGLVPGLNETEMKRRLAPIADDIVAWGYRRLAAASRMHGIAPVWVYLPRPQDGDIPGASADEAAQRLGRLAADAGFVTLDLGDVYDGYEVTSLYLDAADKHPNPIAHQLIAERLYDAFAAHEAPLGFEAAEARHAQIRTER